jgi:hypothetical protein
MRTTCSAHNSTFDVDGTACLQKTYSRALQALLVSPELGHRFAGLCDGEGSFIIHRKRNRGYDLTSYVCRFTMGLRADDQPLLELLRDCLGLGQISIASASIAADRRQPHPTARWDVMAKRDCLRIVQILDEFPLWSKKAADFAIWREAVVYWNKPRRYAKKTRRSATTTRIIQAIDWSPLAELHGELRQIRRYTDRRRNGEAMAATRSAEES